MNLQSTQATTQYPNYAAMVSELLNASRIQRVNIRNAFPFLSDEDGASNLRSLDRIHGEFFMVGFRGPRQTGKTQFAINALMDYQTIVITTNRGYQNAVIDRAVNQITRGFNDEIIRIAVTKRVLTEAAIIHQLDDYSAGKFFISGNGLPVELGSHEDGRRIYVAAKCTLSEYDNRSADVLFDVDPLMCVRRVIVDEYGLMTKIPFRKLLHWSRLGGQVPEFIVIGG